MPGRNAVTDREALIALIDGAGTGGGVTTVPVPGADGDLLVASGGGWVTLAKGANGETLQVTGGAVVWGAVPPASTIDWADITGIPADFPPEPHSHVLADISDLGTLTLPWAALTGVPATFPPSVHLHPWADITGTPTTLAGYGILDAAALVHTHTAAQTTSGAFADARISQSSVTQHQGFLSIGWAQLTGVPATFAPSAHTHPWSAITATPTTLAGYGIVDAAALVHVHAAGDVTSGTFANARISQGSVTQHQAALAIGWAQLTGVPATFAPSAHKASHENAGTDEINVAGLSGKLADKQTPDFADWDVTVTPEVAGYAVLSFRPPGATPGAFDDELYFDSDRGNLVDYNYIQATKRANGVDGYGEAGFQGALYSSTGVSLGYASLGAFTVDDGLTVEGYLRMGAFGQVLYQAEDYLRIDPPTRQRGTDARSERRTISSRNAALVTSPTANVLARFYVPNPGLYNRGVCGTFELTLTVLTSRSAATNRMIQTCRIHFSVQRMGDDDTTWSPIELSGIIARLIGAGTGSHSDFGVGQFALVIAAGTVLDEQTIELRYTTTINVNVTVTRASLNGHVDTSAQQTQVLSDTLIRPEYS